MTKKNLQGYQREAAEKYAKKFGGYGYNTGKVISTSCVYSFFTIASGIVGGALGALAGAGVGAVPLAIVGGVAGFFSGAIIGLALAQSDEPQNIIEGCANSGKSFGERVGKNFGSTIAGPLEYATYRVLNMSTPSTNPTPNGTSFNLDATTTQIGLNHS